MHLSSFMKYVHWTADCLPLTLEGIQSPKGLERHSMVEGYGKPNDNIAA